MSTLDGSYREVLATAQKLPKGGAQHLDVLVYDGNSILDLSGVVGGTLTSTTSIVWMYVASQRDRFNTGQGLSQLG